MAHMHSTVQPSTGDAVIYSWSYPLPAAETAATRIILPCTHCEEHRRCSAEFASCGACNRVHCAVASCDATQLKSSQERLQTVVNEFGVVLEVSKDVEDVREQEGVLLADQRGQKFIRRPTTDQVR